jgi:hypothetical protein
MILYIRKIIVFLKLKLKLINMILSSTTKIGLTFGQILSLITVTAIFMMGYRDLDLRISLMEKKSLETDKMIQDNGVEIEKVRLENREDHAVMMNKIDQILIHQKRQ